MRRAFFFEMMSWCSIDWYGLPTQFLPSPPVLSAAVWSPHGLGRHRESAIAKWKLMGSLERLSPVTCSGSSSAYQPRGLSSWEVSVMRSNPNGWSVWFALFKICLFSSECCHVKFTILQGENGFQSRKAFATEIPCK